MNFFNKAKEQILKHKFISGIAIIILGVAIYYGYGFAFAKKAGTTYVTATASKGTITTSVSGSGQVAASSTINLQFQASGTLIYLPVQNGQKVYQGQLIAELDATNAKQAITSDQASIQAQQISVQKLEGASTLAVPQNKQDAINNEQNAESNLNQDYQSAYNTISSVFTDLPGIMTDLQNTVYGNNFNNNQQNIDFYTGSSNNFDQNAPTFKDSLVKSYAKALSEYTTNFNDYKNTTRDSNNTVIDSAITETFNTSKDIAQAIKDTNNLIQFYKNTLTNENIKSNPLADTQLATINSDSAKASADISNLLNVQTTIKNDENAIATAKEAVANSDLDLQSAQLSLQNVENALANDKANLANYFIYAPFNGTLGKVTAQVGTQVGSGTSVATIITTKDICTIPVNEIDAAKVQVGQKVVLTFNALPDLTVAGQVATIDPIGTVSSGVVTYNVQISFDTQDQRVKPGMSINAAIITNVAQDVLMVPNGAVKTQGTTKYVQVLVNGAPQIKTVTTGVSGTTNTQILSGINAGDKVVTQTITTGSTSAAVTNTSTVRLPGLTGGFSGGRGGL